MVSCRQCKNCYNIQERFHDGHAHNVCKVCRDSDAMDTDYEYMGKSYGQTHYGSRCIFSSIRRSKDINVHKMMEDGGAM